MSYDNDVRNGALKGIYEVLRDLKDATKSIDASLKEIANNPPYTLKPSHDLEIRQFYDITKGSTTYQGSCARCGQKTEWLGSVDSVIEKYRETDCVEQLDGQKPIKIGE